MRDLEKMIADYEKKVKVLQDGLQALREMNAGLDRLNEAMTLPEDTPSVRVTEHPSVEGVLHRLSRPKGTRKPRAVTTHEIMAQLGHAYKVPPSAKSVGQTLKHSEHALRIKRGVWEWR